MGLYVAWRRVKATEDNVRVAQDNLGVAQDNLRVAQDNVRVAEEGHITERFTRAIEQLGKGKMAIRLGEGEHAVVAYVDEVELGRATVQVTTLGEEFLRGVEGECVVDDFLTPGQSVLLEWQQNQQNFVITDRE